MNKWRYTSLEQSKKLAEFLPIDTADGVYSSSNTKYPENWTNKPLLKTGYTPCWSLAALMTVLDDVEKKVPSNWTFSSKTTFYSPIDASCAILLQLYEQKLI